MKIYVVRHGETEWNAENKVCGVTDIDLTDLGIKQAKKLSTRLENHDIELILTSPLKRARKTAEILADCIGKEVIIDSRLIEQNYGVYEGAPRDSEEFRYAKSQFSSRLVTGESLFQVAHRAYGVLEDIQRKYPNKNILVVTHGSVCRVIHSFFNELSNEEYHAFYTANCELKEYVF
jgi:broad specificity phosphatase PhoE